MDLLVCALLGRNDLQESYTVCSANSYREETPALRRLPLRRGQSIYISLQYRCELAAPGFREVELKALRMQRALKQVILVFKLLLWKSRWTSPFRMGESRSSCLSVPLEICVTFPTSSLFLFNYVEEQWIIHPPPLMSHFCNGFPSFLDFSWHHSRLPDQAEVATIGWRNFNCLLKK